MEMGTIREFNMTISERHIKIAEKVAGYSDIIKARVSAIAITKGGTIIATASNRRLYDNFVDWSIHAEAALIKKLNKLCAFNRFKNITIFVFRISSKGISMSRPCIKCQKLLNKYPATIFYTTENGTVEKL